MSVKLKTTPDDLADLQELSEGRGVYTKIRRSMLANLCLDHVRMFNKLEDRMAVVLKEGEA